MSDTLIGVIIGGLIGIVAPISTILFEHYKWKRFNKLEYLKTERMRLEELFNKSLEQLADSIAKKDYPSDLVTDIVVLMPKDVANLYRTYVRDKDKSIENSRNYYFQIQAAMKKSLIDIDKEIKELLS